MRDSLTTAVKRRITEDWQECFPLLTAVKPMWLLKRNGPLLMGLCLDRTRSNNLYVPVFHVHCLAKPSPVISLTLREALPDERIPRLNTEIRVVDHDEHYRRSAERMQRQSPVLLQKGQSLQDALDLYSRYLIERRDPAVCRYPSTLFADVILLTAAMGHREKAQTLFEEAIRTVRAWPAHEVRPPTWQEDISRRLDAAAAQETVMDETKRHGLEAIPDYGLSPRVDESLSIGRILGQ